jgi:hypothetical protein
MPRHLATDEVLEILRSGEFDRFVGALEGDRLECKAAPYQLAEDRQKMELAKDVSALANAEGGVILIGIETAADALHHGEVVRRANIGQCERVLNDWVYPRIRGLQIAWNPSAADATRGIVAIVVPQESLQEQPYLVTKVVESTGRVIGSYAGFFERKRDGVPPLSAQELRDRLKDGLRFSELDRRLENIEENVGRLSAGPAREVRPPMNAAVISERISRARIAAGFDGMPSFILAAWSPEASQFPALFESREVEPVRLLEHPPVLRPAGFDLSSRRPAQIVDGVLRRCIAPRSRLLELWRDGPLSFVTAGDGWHLCWGMRSEPTTGLRINSLALAETTYLFSDLAIKIFGLATPMPERICLRLQLANMTVNDVPCSLSPYRPTEFNLDHDRRPAPGGERVVEAEVPIPNPGPGDAAYRLLGDLYAWFGFDAVDMPFVDRTGTSPAIDPDQIR